MSRNVRSRGRRRTGALLLALGLPVSVATAPATAQGATPGRASADLVRLPFPQDDGTLTPYTFELGYQLMTLVYDTLLWRDDDGVPRPWLARSVDVDGRRVTVTLDPRARWHDGRPVTAGDVAFTFRFVAEHPHPRFSPQFEAVDRVDVADAATVVVTLHHPSPGFLDQPLSDLPILPAHLWNGLAPGSGAPEGLPVGSGPYRLVEHRPGEGYRFEAVADYYRGRPAVDAIEVAVIPDVADIVSALQRGDVDAALVTLPQHVAERLRSAAVRVRKVASYAATVLAFNVARPPFDRVEARRAVAAAIDSPTVARTAGPGVPATAGHLHPSSAWAAVPVRDRLPRRHDRPQLPPLEILVAEDDPVRVRAADAVVDQLRRAGLEATTLAVPRATLDERTDEGAGGPSFAAAVWTAPSLPSHDPDYLRAVFAADPHVGALNRIGYASAAFETAASKVARTEGRSARKAAVAELLAVLADEAPTVPLFFGSATFAYRANVYDGWRQVKGTGPLDKRSFTEPQPPREAAAAPDLTGGNPGVSPLGWAAIALAAAGTAVVIRAVAGRRR